MLTPALLLILISGCASSGAPATGMIPSSDDVRLWYTTIGQGSPIVVIHGGPGMDHGSLIADLTPLTRNHKLIFYDQRGGGRSTLPADTSVLTIEHHVADLEALRRYFGYEKLTLLAHSFGPAIAALYAIEHPANVERMILLGPIPPMKATFFEDYGAALSARLTPEQLARMEELNSQYETASDVQAVCREYWKIATVPRVAKSLPISVVKSDLCTASSDAIRYGSLKTNPATFGSLGDWDWRERLSRVTVPTLIIHGEEDAIPMALVRAWSESMPEARLMALKETGHFPHAERPEIVFPAIEQFLRGPDGTMNDERGVMSRE